jgi:hypothetical protein
MNDEDFSMTMQQRDDDFFATDYAWVFFFAFCLGLMTYPLLERAWNSL